MRNREFVFTPKIEYELVAERSEANQNSLTFPTWCSILELVRTHFSEKIPPQKFGKAAACPVAPPKADGTGVDLPCHATFGYC